jgi:hypothetical protein
MGYACSANLFSSGAVSKRNGYPTTFVDLAQYESVSKSFPDLVDSEINNNK